MTDTTVVDNLMDLHDDAAEKRHVNGAPVYNAVAATARKALLAVLTDALSEMITKQEYQDSMNHQNSMYNQLKTERDQLLEQLAASQREEIALLAHVEELEKDHVVFLGQKDWIMKSHNQACDARDALQARVADLEESLLKAEGRLETMASLSLRVDEKNKALRQQLSEAQALVEASRKQVPQAWTNLLAYALQDDMQNRLTPRVIDIAYAAFTLAKQPNNEDGGASDWFNDTKPTVVKLIAKLKKDLCEDLDAAPVIAPDVLKDAERYRWFFGDVNLQAITDACEQGKPIPEVNSELLGQIIGFYSSKQQVDALIDAAMGGAA